jgi:hypothetical protein
LQLGGQCLQLAAALQALRRQRRILRTPLGIDALHHRLHPGGGLKQVLPLDFQRGLVASLVDW